MFGMEWYEVLIVVAYAFGVISVAIRYYDEYTRDREAGLRAKNGGKDPLKDDEY